jgi:hypothetical protein
LSRIEDLLKEFADRIREAAIEEAFETMRAAVGGPARRRRGPGRPPGRRAKGEKRDTKALDALTSKLHSAIKSTPGKRVEEIARSLGTTTKELMLPMRKLRAAKKIRMSGTRRAARYFPK